MSRTEACNDLLILQFEEWLTKCHYFIFFLGWNQTRPVRLSCKFPERSKEVSHSVERKTRIHYIHQQRILAVNISRIKWWTFNCRQLSWREVSWGRRRWWWSHLRRSTKGRRLTCVSHFCQTPEGKDTCRANGVCPPLGHSVRECFPHSATDCVYILHTTWSVLNWLWTHSPSVCWLRVNGEMWLSRSWMHLLYFTREEE